MILMNVHYNLFFYLTVVFCATDAIVERKLMVDKEHSFVVKLNNISESGKVGNVHLHACSHTHPNKNKLFKNTHTKILTLSVCIMKITVLLTLCYYTGSILRWRYCGCWLSGLGVHLYKIHAGKIYSLE